MKLSTKTRYGTRAMLDLALHYGSGATSVKDIATRQQVSPKYLEHLLASLRSAGLVRSVRGAQGGYTLTSPPERINLRQIHDVFEGTAGFVECTTSPEICDRTEICVTMEIWDQLHTAVLDILESTTLEDLAHRALEKQSNAT